ncbi:hypothetical protein B484DRAFT_283033 [Ochromonadaceae sp. CCMP2298]|nr:hypothetical protein B484DRAFT_283033 [Ochromonadaceae sp. CCMP2298]
MFIWLYGYMVIWLYSYMVIWLYGYMVIWLYGYMVIWLYGYMYSYTSYETWYLSQILHEFVHALSVLVLLPLVRQPLRVGV